MLDSQFSKLLAAADDWSNRAMADLLARLPEDWVAYANRFLPENTDLRFVVGGAVLLLVVLFVFRLVRRRRVATADRALSDLTGGPRRAAMAIVLLLVLGLGTWSFTAPLESAAIAPGVISPDGSRRTVQHLEGGIIQKIHAREGDVVTEGQLLLVLDDLEAQARFDEIGKRYAYLLARSARLEAELQESAIVDMPKTERWIDQAHLEAAFENQRQLLKRRIEAQNGREEILQKRMQQLEEEISGLRRMNEGLDEKMRLTQEESASVSQLVDKGLARKGQLLAIGRAEADIDIQRAGNDAQIARNLQKIGESEVQLIAMIQQHIEDASEEMAEVQRAVAELESELPWRADILQRTEVRSPIAGTVMNMRVATASGVIRGGEPILDIVPQGVPLVIDAHVKPTDIDVIKKGMLARVILSAYQQRNLPQIFGTLRSISPDRFVDERSGASYFLAKIEVPPAQLDNLPTVDLVPGMPADVMLLTGERTVADYLIGPLLASVRVSFRENHGG